MRHRFFAVISVFVFGILYFYTAVSVLITLIFAFLHLKKPLQMISQIWAKSVFIIIGKKFRLSGKENIKKDSRYILVANHGSLFDIVAIMSIYPGVSWFGHERLLKVPLFGKLLKMNGYIAFKEPNYRNTKAMVEQLILRSKDQTVAIFPEGTRTLDGRINDFYRGFIYLIRNSEVDILPVTLNGFYDLKPKNRSYINFDADLDIIVHKPIRREDLIDRTDIEIVDAVKEVILSAYRENHSSVTLQKKEAS
ncbi:MAG: 1-acyl-sn-glycerol-3-phosphate acyltransferase [Bacteroidetes bacterium]|nr:1-acyl-sn-glycerol-3-phosphate acyltransferase [Bacteroidota bacterium]